MRRFWVIEHYNGLKLISEHKIPVGQITEEQIENLLKTLVAKHALTDEEIIPCYLKRNSKRYWEVLEIQKDSKFHTLSCGINPYVIARVVEED